MATSDREHFMPIASGEAGSTTGLRRGSFRRSSGDLQAFLDDPGAPPSLDTRSWQTESYSESLSTFGTSFDGHGRIPGSSSWDRPNQATAFIEAAQAGDVEEVRSYVVRGVELETRDPRIGMTALSWAARRGHLEVVKLLLERGADVEAGDCKLRTPLHRACSGGSYEVARVLIAYGARVDSRDSTWRTPLHRAARWGSRESAQLLLDAGADIEARDAGFARTPLHYACRQGAPETIQFLLENGADLGSKTAQLNTALHLACDRGLLDATRLLLEWGARPGECNCRGLTAGEVIGPWVDDHLKAQLLELLEQGPAFSPSGLRAPPRPRVVRERPPGAKEADAEALAAAAAALASEEGMGRKSGVKFLLPSSPQAERREATMPAIVLPRSLLASMGEPGDALGKALEYAKQAAPPMPPPPPPAPLGPGTGDGATAAPATTAQPGESATARFPVMARGHGNVGDGGGGGGGDGVPQAKQIDDEQGIGGGGGGGGGGVGAVEARAVPGPAPAHGLGCGGGGGRRGATQARLRSSGVAGGVSVSGRGRSVLPPPVSQTGAPLGAFVAGRGTGRLAEKVAASQKHQGGCCAVQ